MEKVSGSTIKNLTAPYYTRQNLEIILGSNRRTLDYRISKLISEDILETIKPGFYINKRQLLQSSQKDIFLEYVGNVAKYPSYVSLEYALSKYGLIPESIYAVTYITTKKTGEYSSSVSPFKYRNIKPKLFTDYEERDFGGAKYLFAKEYKALFDFIYLTPLEKLSDFKQLLFGSRINWDALLQGEKDDFAKLCTASGSKKMQKVINLLTKEGLL